MAQARALHSALLNGDAESLTELVKAKVNKKRIALHIYIYMYSIYICYILYVCVLNISKLRATLLTIMSILNVS